MSVLNTHIASSHSDRVTAIQRTAAKAIARANSLPVEIMSHRLFGSRLDDLSISAAEELTLCISALGILARADSLSIDQLAQLMPRYEIREIEEAVSRLRDGGYVIAKEGAYRMIPRSNWGLDAGTNLA